MDLAVGVWLILASAAVAEHFQPVRVRLAGQQFGGTLVDALGAFATQETAMVEKELQQLQVARADFPTQEKVVAQPTVDVLDDRTGADDLLAQVTHGLLQRMETIPQALSQRRLLLPAERLALVQRLQVEQFANAGDRRRKLGGEIGQILLKLQGESQDLVPVVLQERAYRTEAMRAERRACLPFGDDEIEEQAAVGVRQPGHGENIGAQPARQHGHVVGQRDRLGLFRGDGGNLAAQRLDLAALIASALLLQFGLLAFEFVMGGDRVVGPIFQKSNHRRDFVQGMKDIAAAGDAGQGALLARANAGAEIGDRGRGSEAAVLAFEQTQGPGVAIALVFGAEQEAVGGTDVGADENGLALLEDFVETGDVHVGEILAVVVKARLVDGILHDVVDGADGHGDAEEVATKFVDATIGTVADEGQAERGLREPILGDRQLEEHLVVVCGGRGESIVQSGPSRGGLASDELATDLVVVGQSGDGLRARQGLEANRQPLARRQRLGGATMGNRLLDRQDCGSKIAHVCFLRETGGFAFQPVWGKQTT